jgi:polysaccharide export outer membrane protein
MIRRTNEVHISTRRLSTRGMALAIGVGVAIFAAATASLRQDHLYDGPPSPSTIDAATRRAQSPVVQKTARVAQETAGDETTNQQTIPSFPMAVEVDLGQFHDSADSNQRTIQLCQAYGPAAPRPMHGGESNSHGHGGAAQWDGWRPIPWQVFAQGEYVGPHRPQHVPEYRVRVDDQVDFVYRLTRELSPTPYKLNVGDSVRVESLTDEKIDRDLVIQPDGSITLRLLGQVRAADRTVDELRQLLEEQYKKYYKVPAITVTPVRVDTRVTDLIASINNQFDAGVQSRRVRVTPEGTVQLPAIGSVPAQGLTLDELKFEIDERYAQIVSGIEVMPILFARAPRFLYVVGEVRTPGRFTMEAPTTVMQAIALAGGWNVGGNLREVVIFRRTENWQLVATKLDIRAALLGRTPTPCDEIWLRDSDVVVVPKTQVLLTNHFIELVFTRGIYGVLPINGSYNINAGSRL